MFSLHSRGAHFILVITDENAITNAVDIFQNPTGSIRVMTTSNDAQVRVFDIKKFTCLNRFSFECQGSVNNTSVSPDCKLLAVLGDGADCLIDDAQSGKVCRITISMKLVHQYN